MVAVFLQMLDPVFVVLTLMLTLGIVLLWCTGLVIVALQRALHRWVWGTAVAIGLAAAWVAYDCRGCWWCFECIF